MTKTEHDKFLWDPLTSDYFRKVSEGGGMFFSRCVINYDFPNQIEDRLPQMVVDLGPDTI